jgi:hypothetical protein
VLFRQAGGSAKIRVVAWRYRKDGVQKGGGGQQHYTGTARDGNSPALPTISCGTDVTAVIDVMMPHMSGFLEALQKGQPAPEPDVEKINAELARRPWTPDEKLR